MKKADLRVGMVLECRLDNLKEMPWFLVTSMNKYGWNAIRSQFSDSFYIPADVTTHNFHASFNGWLALKYFRLKVADE